MARIIGQSLKPNISSLFKNPYFWANLAFTIILIIIYRAWPWRLWQLEQDIWQKVQWLSALSNLATFEYRAHIVGILFLIPIICGVVIFKFWGALIFSLLTLISVFPLIKILWSSVYLRITNLVFLLLPVTVVLLVYIEIELLRKNRISFIRERQQYTSMVLAAQERERQRIAQELHDETIQTLVAISKRAESISSSKENVDVVWIRDGILQTIDDLRRISLDLRPSILDSMGLIPAVRWLVDRLNLESSISAQLVIDGVKRDLSPSTEVNIFRIVQEALSNIKAHSKASQAVVTLQFYDKFLRLTLQDNGQGFPQSVNSNSLLSLGRLGLIGIQERIMSLAGTFEVASKPDVGTKLTVEIPISYVADKSETNGSLKITDTL